MKIKRIASLFIALTAFSFFGYGQVEQVDAPMFGTTRGLNAAFAHDFADISGKIVSHQFKIKNDGKANMEITDVDIPEKVGVTILSKNIAPGEEGVIVVTVDPTIADQGKLNEKVVVTTVQKEMSVITTKEMTFSIKGDIK